MGLGDELHFEVAAETKGTLDGQMRIIIISRLRVIRRSEQLMSDIRQSSNRHSTSGSKESAGEPRRVSSDELIGAAREVLIRHAGCDYRLRITRLGKLILTK
jgi:hemin uptake protein HemP